MAKTAFVTGITGQDGSYLTELLLAKGYEVHGLIRQSSNWNTHRIDHLHGHPGDRTGRLFLHYGDLTQGTGLAPLLSGIQPDEVFHLAAQSHVGVSFDLPLYTADVVGLGTLRLFESLVEANLRPRVYQASSSEMFGNAPAPQTEQTPLSGVSPYAIAKIFAHQIAEIYRDVHGFFVARGILFNHESPRRGPAFVTRKVTRAVARICAGKEDKVALGNLNAKRDWGYAPEYVEIMWQMLQHDKPLDLVVATGEARSVSDLCQVAFGLVGEDWRQRVDTDSRYLRPNEVALLVGDASLAQTELGWQPQVGFAELVQIMLEADLTSQGVDPGKYLGTSPLHHRPSWARVP